MFSAFAPPPLPPFFLPSLSLSQSSMDPELHVTEPIPQQRFLFITAAIIATTLTIAILIPHGQFVWDTTYCNLHSFMLHSGENI